MRAAIVVLGFSANAIMSTEHPFLTHLARCVLSYIRRKTGQIGIFIIFNWHKPQALWLCFWHDMFADDVASVA